ncbi:MAG: hypothetical protein ACKVOM_01190 [Ferruginibacter sp.]
MKQLLFMALLVAGFSNGLMAQKKGANPKFFVSKPTMTVTPSQMLNGVSFSAIKTPSIEFGYFLRPNIAIGSNVEIKAPFNWQQLVKTNGSFSAFGRYYINTPLPALKVYAQGNASYGQATTSTIGDPTTNVFSRKVSLSVQPGITYFTSKVIGFDVKMNGIGAENTLGTTNISTSMVNFKNATFSAGILAYF